MIAIIGAMDEEIALLLTKIEVQSDEMIANSRFIQGKLEGKEVVLLKSGIGKVNAAMATTILHERYQPTAVINTGSAGGLDTSLSIGDIVISDRVVHHDVDVTAFDYQYGQVPSMPLYFESDQNLINIVEKTIQSINQVNCKQGLIATGDSFIQKPEAVQKIREQFPDVIAAEMEAVAIAQVCHQYQTPFVVIRALSDIAGKESAQSFDQFIDQAARHAAELIIKVVKQL
ncbi:5'-methylthioadenosine/S-adenosylhomocysteine nucleosidase [Amphibacillus xylanus]|uniref:5'-methylthioadenosine/S-adenosylhomocysteine nucleosidase n=1 Tax=Amphibacillus xylanus (strain ATCC 51415 / DSM 6626 / JCM 7361 / LMG 17667 / NBRC 15112 / Ep01) TaxID=698758 RepID=K0IXT2_AMPXN|nr:5'-methylthioadenosine/S-adenosylhomocysteine nucleosidase [Amphibacillus xylanus]BAM47209.1 5'-methylthioadenosine/S-adenosylhomocysteine nucleosidase [Amphibacillus xylanus NBRC 15112]